MKRLPHHKGFKPRHSTLRMRRQRLNEQGKKVRAWAAARRKLKVEFEALGITSCELNYQGCSRNDLLSFAHSKKRRFLNDHELKHVVIVACFSCHRQLDEVMSHEEMEATVLSTIEKRKLAA